jgi:carbonic anhydrase
MPHVDYKPLTSKPDVHIDTYFKSVRMDGDFGVINTARGSFKAKYVHFVGGKSFHELDGESKQVEMMIVHERVEPTAPWNPEPSTSVDTIIVSVLFETTAGASSDLLEAIGFTPDAVVIDTTWHSKAKSEGLLNYATKSLSDYVGAALAGDYYSYHGSLPVPPCWENVIYYVSGTVLPVSHEQVEGLDKVLRTALEDPAPRPVEPLKKIVVTKNTFSVPGFNGNWAAGSCPDLPTEDQEVVAICFMCPADTVKSPVNLVETEAHPVLGEFPPPKIAGYSVPRLSYHPVMAVSERGKRSVVVRPEAGHNFGTLEIGGRFYTAKLITVHAVSGMHTINGEGFDGEIHIHHYVYGDWFADESAEHEHQYRRLDAFRGNTRESEQAIEGGPSYQVIVAIPLKITTNPAAKSMNDLMPNAMREMPFAAHDDFKEIFAGDFMQYQGTLIYPKCSDKVTHWIVYKTPLKVNKAQVFTEYPTRSGFDTTPKLSTAAFSAHRNVIPLGAMGSGRSCSSMGAGEWTYADSYCWGEITNTDGAVAYPACSASSRRQSPVNLISSEATPAAHKEPFLNFVKYHPMLHLKVVNTGHSLQIADKTNGKSHMGLGYLTYGDHYYFVRQFHLHFPSEHTTDGRVHAAELHIVHQMQAHWGPEAFEGKAANEVLVAGIFFDIGDEESPLLAQMLPEPGEEVNSEWSKTLHEPLDLMRAFGPILDGDYYRYDGSFTTPPCSEIIKWFMFKKSLSMSMAQWDMFKKLFKNPANARPVQPLYERNVTMNTFKASGEAWSFPTYQYYLDRNHGRNRDTPSSLISLGGIIGAIVIAILIMYATFIPQNSESLKGSAGGLDANPAASFMGRSLGGLYGRFNDNRV